MGVPENVAQNLVSSTAILNRPKGKEKYAEDIIISVFQVDPFYFKQQVCQKHLLRVSIVI